jgi:hypothetical protein
MKVAVRFVVFKLCVPLNAMSVEFATVGLPNANHPCGVPSSKSLEIGALKAADVLASDSV